MPTLNSTVLSLVDAQALRDAADILHYLSNVEPFRGCSFDSDESFQSGHMRILEHVEKMVRSIADNEEVPTPEEASHA
jgi:hypothetical protein